MSRLKKQNLLENHLEAISLICGCTERANMQRFWHRNLKRSMVHMLIFNICWPKILTRRIMRAKKLLVAAIFRHENITTQWKGELHLFEHSCTKTTQSYLDRHSSRINNTKVGACQFLPFVSKGCWLVKPTEITFPQLYLNTFKKIVQCCRFIAQGDICSSKAPGYYCHVSFILGLHEPSKPNAVR